MQKGWSFLFGGVILAAVALFVVAPFVGWWLPINVSSFGHQVDNLFYLILGITGFFFILVEALLVYFMYAFAGRPLAPEQGRAPQADKKLRLIEVFKPFARPITAVIYNQHRLEMFWTLVPAVILLFIALIQVRTWADIKYQSAMPAPDQILEVSARQFEWRLRYPAADDLETIISSWKTDAKHTEARDWDEHPRIDDIHVDNEVHTWKGAHVRVNLKTRDVIHSFYLPNLRLKQDALPGKTIPVWFKAIQANTRFDAQSQKWLDGYRYDEKTGNWEKDGRYLWELACAELCGWGHYKMRGKLFVHLTKQDFLHWLEFADYRQNYPAKPKPTFGP